MQNLEALNLHDPNIRRYIVENYGLAGFTWVYLPHHFYQEPADFHPELIQSLEDPLEEMLLVIGFRGSAKSTYGSLATPMYLALENKANFILPVSDTTTQMKLNIENIKYELENNELILKDYGVTYNTERNWSTQSLTLLNGTLILGRSRGQKMRGLKHRQYRPQVVIIDDPEDLEWVKKKENRDKTERWVTSEVIPAVQEDHSKLVIIGNLLHKDALMYRLKKKTKPDGTPLFKCLEFPLIDDSGHCTWQGKYPTQEAIDKQKARVGSATAWAREYMLKIIATDDQVVKEEDIHKYDVSILDKRDDDGKLKHPVLDGGVGNDLAISEKQTADFTSMVSAKKVNIDGRTHILILPNPVNKRMGFDATLKEAQRVNAIMPYGTKWYVEDVGYQKAAIEKMRKEGLSVYPMRAISDKKARFEAVSPFIIDGTVLFPEHGCEELLEQLLGFGTEEHDDLLDALVYLIMGMTKRRSYKAMERPDKI